MSCIICSRVGVHDTHIGPLVIEGTGVEGGSKIVCLQYCMQQYVFKGVVNFSSRIIIDQCK